MKKKLLFVLAFSLAVSGLTIAETATDNLSVSGRIGAACEIISITPIDFGDVTTNQTATGDITVNCGIGVSYQIVLNAGQHLQNNTRRMVRDFENYAIYRLCKDAGCAQEWGDNSTYGAGAPKSDTGNGADQSHTVFGESLPAIGQAVGTYTDTVLVGVFF